MQCHRCYLSGPHLLSHQMYPRDHAINSQDTKTRTATVVLRPKSMALIMVAAAEVSLAVGVQEETTWTGIRNVLETVIAIVNVVRGTERGSETESATVRERGEPRGMSGSVVETNLRHPPPEKIRRKRRGRERNERKKRKRDAGFETLRTTD